MRMCVGCREMKEKRELIRIVRTPEGETLIDPGGKKSGRGAYVCRNPECLKRAIKQKQLERQLQVSLTEEVSQALIAEMNRLSEMKLPEAEGEPGTCSGRERAKSERNARTGSQGPGSMLRGRHMHQADRIREMRDDPAGRGNRGEHPEKVSGTV